MRYAFALGVTALIVNATCAFAQGADPYAAGIANTKREQLQKDYAEFLKGVRVLYFAVGCKAILFEPYAAYAITNTMPSFVERGISGDEIQQQVKIGVREGLAKASEGCQVWKNAPPEAIIALRKMVEAGVMP